MILDCQKRALQDLPKLANCGTHGLVISGSAGCGKHYIARQFAKSLNIHDFNIISPNMNDIRTMVDSANTTDVDTVFCVENMDSAITSVAYPLLKLIEECPENVYIVITCTNLNQIPDTIISRCAILTISNPTFEDIKSYGVDRNVELFNTLSTKNIWKCIKSFDDVDTMYKLSTEQLSYFDSIVSEFTKSKLGVQSLVWKLQHFEDKSPTPVSLLVRYIMFCNPTKSNLRVFINCLNELEYNRISVNAILTKLVFDLKYLG